MSEPKPRGVWFYLFGCTPATMAVLLGILFALVLGPMAVNLVMSRLNPPEPRVFPLPDSTDGRPWVLVEGKWRFAQDRDDDGNVDCFVRVASGRDFFAVDGRPKGCAMGTMRLLARMRGVIAMDGDLRAALTEAARYKRERGWLSVSVIDSDGNDTPDCVIDRFGGVIARRTSTTCPGDAYSIPAMLETHERFAELSELFRLEHDVRRAVVGSRERAESN